MVDLVFLERIFGQAEASVSIKGMMRQAGEVRPEKAGRRIQAGEGRPAKAGRRRQAGEGRGATPSSPGPIKW